MAYQQAKIDLSYVRFWNPMCGETTNVAEQHPEVVQQIVRLGGDASALPGWETVPLKKLVPVATRPDWPAFAGGSLLDWPLANPGYSTCAFHEIGESRLPEGRESANTPRNFDDPILLGGVRILAGELLCQ